MDNIGPGLVTIGRVLRWLVYMPYWICNVTSTAFWNNVQTLVNLWHLIFNSRRATISGAHACSFSSSQNFFTRTRCAKCPLTHIHCLFSISATWKLSSFIENRLAFLDISFLILHREEKGLSKWINAYFYWKSICLISGFNHVYVCSQPEPPSLSFITLNSCLCFSLLILLVILLLPFRSIEPAVVSKTCFLWDVLVSAHWPFVLNIFSVVSSTLQNPWIYHSKDFIITLESVFM